MAKMKLDPKDVTIDPGVLPRIRDDGPVVDEYEAIMRLGKDDLPPPVLFFDGDKRWLADGVKRRAAGTRIGDTVTFDVRKGTRSDAIFYAAGANREHGVRLSSKETRRAVENLLQDGECAKNADGIIAGQCGVSVGMVQKRRAALAKATGKEPPKTRKTKTGTTITPKPSGKGGRKRQPGRPRQPPKPKKLKPPKGVLQDGLKDPVPDWAREVFIELGHIHAYWNGLSDVVITPAEALVELPSGAGQKIKPKEILSHLNEIRNHVRDSMPYCVCPDCRDAGRLRKSCDRCGGRSWLTKPEYQLHYLA